MLCVGCWGPHLIKPYSATTVLKRHGLVSYTGLRHVKPGKKNIRPNIIWCLISYLSKEHTAEMIKCSGLRKG